MSLFSSKAVFNFDQVRTQGSVLPGIQGRAEIKTGSEGSYKVEADIAGLDLQEIHWLNPDNLQGSSGLITGKITLDGKFDEDPHFTVILASKDGKVQSKLFNILLPYLPALPTKKRMAELSSANAVLPFRNAAMQLALPEPGKMKIFLHILIPDYNVELNLNFEIHLEEKMSLSEIAQILGIVKVSQ
jgi:hypothetical protein